MSRTWLNDGNPDESGRLCLEIDPEDGTRPLRIWGRTKDEILDKATRTVEHGQRAIAQLKAKVPANPSSSATDPRATAAAQVAVSWPALSDSEKMQLTVDLNDPAKAPAAIARLMQEETGIDFSGIKHQETVRRIAGIETAWQLNRPDFPKHPVNFKLINDTAALRVGYENITADVLDQVFTELSTAGMLVSAEDDDALSTPTVHPAETPALRTVRPRGAASYRRATVASPSPAPASQQPKYTRAQIESMSSAEYRRKLETEPGFADAVAALNASSAPTAQA